MQSKSLADELLTSKSHRRYAIARLTVLPWLAHLVQSKDDTPEMAALLHAPNPLTA